MKLKTLQTVILEQHSPTSEFDPFAPIPYDGVADGIQDAEIAKLEHLRDAYAAVDSALNMRHNDMLRDRHLYHNSRAMPKSNYHSNGINLTKPETVAPGDISWGLYTYAMSALHPEHLAFMQRYASKFNKATIKQILIDKAIKAAKRRVKKEKEQANIDASQNASTAPSSNLAPSQIPAYVKTQPNAANKGVLNPYVQDTTSGDRYAGPPNSYNFTSQMRTLYTAIELALRRHGKTLSVIYAGRPYASKGYNAINFIATTADGMVVWRKYDAAPGSGQNWIILNGVKMNTSTFVKATPSQQDNYLRSNGVIK